MFSAGRFEGKRTPAIKIAGIRGILERNFYEILGISHTAQAEEIKRAYRVLARKYHPDANNPDASETLFRKVSEAYSTLSSSERRAKYNESLGIPTAGEGDSQFDSKHRIQGHVFDQESVGKQRSVNSPVNNNKVSKEQNKKSTGRAKRFDGTTSARMSMPPPSSDKHDDDSLLGKITRAFSGIRSAPEIDKKSTSSRQREVDLRGDRVYHFSIDGLESMVGTMRDLALKGEGDPRLVKVRIPAGVSDQDILKVKVQIDGEEESLPIRVSIVPHEYVLREGKDVILRVPLTFSESLQGVELDLPAFGANVKVKIPPMWDVKKRLRVAGKGVCRGEDGESGDLYVEVVLVPPDRDPPGVNEIAVALNEAYLKNPRQSFPKKFSS